MNLEAPHIHGTIKLHKQAKPVRPIVNWKNSSGYKTAAQLTKILKKHDTIT
jgi:sugar (pentulose or hexulose) kinase